MPRIYKNRGRPPNQPGKKKVTLTHVKTPESDKKKAQMKTRYQCNKKLKQQIKQNEKNEKIIDKHKEIIKKQKQQIKWLNCDNQELEITNEGYFCILFFFCIF